MFFKKISYRATASHIVSLTFLLLATRSIIWTLFFSAGYGYGFEVLLLIILTAIASDVGGYFIGSLFGKRKNKSPIISKKNLRRIAGWFSTSLYLSRNLKSLSFRPLYWWGYCKNKYFYFYYHINICCGSINRWFVFFSFEANIQSRWFFSNNPGARGNSRSIR